MTTKKNLGAEEKMHARMFETMTMSVDALAHSMGADMDPDCCETHRAMRADETLQAVESDSPWHPSNFHDRSCYRFTGGLTRIVDRLLRAPLGAFKLPE